MVSLTNSLVAKMLTVLVSTICNSQVFLLKKIGVAFANAHFFSKNINITHIFSAKILAYLPYLMVKVLPITNDIVNFKHQGPVVQN